MPRHLLPLFAIIALLCTAPLHAQVEAPQAPDAGHALVGTWMGLSMDGEPLEAGDFVLTFKDDGTGSIMEGGDKEPEPFTYTYDADTQRCVIYFDGDEDDAFPIDVAFDGDTATFAPENEDDVLVARRVGAGGDNASDAAMDAAEQLPAGEVPPPPAPIDTSDSPLLGRWMLVQFNGEPVPDGLVAYDHHGDGTGRVIENGEAGEAFGWQHDVDRGAVIVETPTGETLTFYVVLYEDLAVYVADPAHGDMRIVHRRMPEAGDVGNADAPGVPAAAPLVGAWEGVSSNGEPIDPDDTVRIVFHADGTGNVYEDGDDADPFTWSYDADAESCTIVSDDVELAFMVSFDGDTVSFESEEMEMFLVMRRIPADGEDGMDGEDGEDGADGRDAVGRGGADAEHPEGVTGVWYAQKAEGDWVPAEDEFRLEFRADGTAVAFENGEQEDDVVRYAVDEDRRIIQILRDNGELEVELRYDLFDDIMVLTFLPPDGFEDTFEGDEMEILLCRRPEGNEEHQRMRAGADGGHPATGDNPRGRAQRMQSMTNLRELSVCLFAYFADHDHAPETLGAAFEYMQDAQAYFTAWQDIVTPDAWDDMALDARAEWLDANTGYAYIGGEAASPLLIGEGEIGPGEAVVIFELPLFADTELISVAFADGHVERLPYDEADALIEEQTGRDLMGWMGHLGREQLPAGAPRAEDRGDHDEGDSHGDE
jgi:hypothetical protein